MKKMIIIILTFMVLSCSDDVYNVGQAQNYTCDYVKHCETLPPETKYTLTEVFNNKSVEDLDSAKALVERVNEIVGIKCEIREVYCR